MSQISDLGPSFYFMQSRKKVLKNGQKLPVFLHKIKTKAAIKNLRDSSLKKMLLLSMLNFRILSNISMLKK